MKPAWTAALLALALLVASCQGERRVGGPLLGRVPCQALPMLPESRHETRLVEPAHPPTPPPAQLQQGAPPKPEARNRPLLLRRRPRRCSRLPSVWIRLHDRPQPCLAPDGDAFHDPGPRPHGERAAGGAASRSCSAAHIGARARARAPTPAPPRSPSQCDSGCTFILSLWTRSAPPSWAPSARSREQAFSGVVIASDYGTGAHDAVAFQLPGTGWALAAGSQYVLMLETATTDEWYGLTWDYPGPGLWDDYGSGFAAYDDIIWSMAGTWYGAWNGGGGLKPDFELTGERCAAWRPPPACVPRFAQRPIVSAPAPLPCPPLAPPQEVREPSGPVHVVHVPHRVPPLRQHAQGRLQGVRAQGGPWPACLQAAGVCGRRAGMPQSEWALLPAPHAMQVCYEIDFGCTKPSVAVPEPCDPLDPTVCAHCRFGYFFDALSKRVRRRCRGWLAVRTTACLWSAPLLTRAPSPSPPCQCKRTF